MSINLEKYFSEKIKLIDDVMATRWLPAKTEDPSQLFEAMHYSLFAKGKRIRPMLVFATADALDIPLKDVLPIAASLEMIHVFSLIHDDLPAMDDDDLRRGQPTNHKVFGEAVAILAGDALLSQAFIPLTELNAAKYHSHNILQVIRLFAECTGGYGMIGGQVIDLDSEGKTINLERLKKLHRLKTGALIRCAIDAPAILTDTAEPHRTELSRFGQLIGLAFQIQDDILDIEGGTELGKDIGSDVEKGKSTFPSLLGLNQAKQEAEKTFQEALACLNDFDEKADALRAIAAFIVNRRT